MTDVNRAIIAFQGASAMLGETRIGPFDLAIHEGETVVLVGESGAGKTTLLRMANALVLPAEFLELRARENGGARQPRPPLMTGICTSASHTPLSAPDSSS